MIPLRGIIHENWSQFLKIYKLLVLNGYLKRKYHIDGILDKHKVQLFAKGYSQVEGVDYEETVSPTTKYTSLRCGIQLAAQYNWCIFQMDVKSTVLNGKLMEEVYVDQPPGFEISALKKHYMA